MSAGDLYLLTPWMTAIETGPSGLVTAVWDVSGPYDTDLSDKTLTWT